MKTAIFSKAGGNSLNADDIIEQVEGYFTEDYLKEHGPQALIAGALVGIGAYVMLDNMTLVKAKGVVDDLATIAFYDNIKDVLGGFTTGVPAGAVTLMAAGIPAVADLGEIIANAVVPVSATDPTAFDPNAKLTIAVACAALAAFTVYVVPRNN